LRTQEYAYNFACNKAECVKFFVKIPNMFAIVY